MTENIEAAEGLDLEPMFNIRPFRAKDISPMVRIISKIGLREFSRIITPENMAALVGEAEDGEDGGSKAGIVGAGVMLEVASIICENFDRVEEDMFVFLASLAGINKSEVENLSLADTFELLYSVCKVDDFADFFTRARALLAKPVASLAG